MAGAYGSATNNPSPDNPVDELVSRMIGTVANKGRGFVLGVVPGEDGKRTEIRVVEELPPLDERETKPPYRKHTVNDSESLIAMAKRYGSKEKSIIFIGDECVSLVLDEEPAIGKRETIKLTFQPSQDWQDWDNIVNNNEVEHRTFVKFLQSHEDNLQNGDILIALMSVQATAKVAMNSEVADMGEKFGIQFQTEKSEKTANIPKQFAISIPVLDEDNDGGKLQTVTLKLDVVMPRDANAPVLKFRVYSSKWSAAWRERISHEESIIRKGLPDYTIVKGATGYKRRLRDADLD